MGSRRYRTRGLLRGRRDYRIPDYVAGPDRGTIAQLAADRSVHGILCQLPLPDGLDAEPVIALIPFEKDVDGLPERSISSWFAASQDLSVARRWASCGCYGATAWPPPASEPSTRAADLILGNTPLPPEHVSFFRA